MIDYGSFIPVVVCFVVYFVALFALDHKKKKNAE